VRVLESAELGGARQAAQGPVAHSIHAEMTEKVSNQAWG
jgi:hypothetical protein